MACGPQLLTHLHTVCHTAATAIWTALKSDGGQTRKGLSRDPKHSLSAISRTSMHARCRRPDDAATNPAGVTTFSLKLCLFTSGTGSLCRPCIQPCSNIACSTKFSTVVNGIRINEQTRITHPTHEPWRCALNGSIKLARSGSATPLPSARPRRLEPPRAYPSCRHLGTTRQQAGWPPGTRCPCTAAPRARAAAP